MSQNSITLIKPYKWEGLWVFDDERVDLVREAFVAGAVHDVQRTNSSVSRMRMIAGKALRLISKRARRQGSCEFWGTDRK